VLVTGAGDDPQKILNTLYGDSGVVRSDQLERLPGTFHGAGATLAAAVAAAIAKGLEDAGSRPRGAGVRVAIPRGSVPPRDGSPHARPVLLARELDEGEEEA